MKVAVVDDDPSVQKALGRLLRAEGFEAETFASGQEFLNSLEQSSPGCLMLDLHMPGMSGLDVQQALIAAKNDTPVIVVTSVDDADVVRRTLEAGAVACLTKPVDTGTLLCAVQEVLAGGGARSAR